jgi:hypothetical protein
MACPTRHGILHGVGNRQSAAVPLRVGQKGERSGPKPFSTEWILAPPEEEPVRRPPDLPVWLQSERKLLALFIICVSIIIAIGGSSGGSGDGDERPAVQPPTEQTATVVPSLVQPNSVRGTEPQLPPLPTTTVGPTVISLPPTQTPAP